MLHINLDSDCIEIGGYDSREFRGLLAHYLKTTIPTKMKPKTMVCHSCGNHKCSNPLHLYWGTNSDNLKDSIEHGTYKNPFDGMVKKHGRSKALEIARINASKGGRGNKGKKRISSEVEELYKKTILKYIPLKYGDISKISRELGISHTHVSRLIKELDTKT